MRPHADPRLGIAVRRKVHDRVDEIAEAQEEDDAQPHIAIPNRPLIQNNVRDVAEQETVDPSRGAHHEDLRPEQHHADAAQHSAPVVDSCHSSVVLLEFQRNGQEDLRERNTKAVSKANGKSPKWHYRNRLIMSGINSLGSGGGGLIRIRLAAAAGANGEAIMGHGAWREIPHYARRGGSGLITKVVRTIKHDLTGDSPGSRCSGPNG